MCSRLQKCARSQIYCVVDVVRCWELRPSSSYILYTPGTTAEIAHEKSESRILCFLPIFPFFSSTREVPKVGRSLENKCPTKRLSSRGFQTHLYSCPLLLIVGCRGSFLGGGEDSAIFFFRIPDILHIFGPRSRKL